MRPGVSFPSYAAVTTFAMVSGSAHASYPVANLAVLRKPTTPFKASGAGAIAFSAVLAASTSLQCVALCNHNAEAGETYQIRLYSDAGMSSLVADSGALTFQVHPEALYMQTTVHVFAAAVTARAVRVDLSAQTAAWRIGACEVAGFWDLTHHDERSLGVRAQDQRMDVGRNVEHRTAVFAPRSASIGSSLIGAAADQSTFADFVVEKGADLPFVYVRDADDSATYREAFLARLAGQSYRRGPADASGDPLDGFRIQPLEHLA